MTKTYSSPRFELFLDGTPEAEKAMEYVRGLGIDYTPVPADELGAFWGRVSATGLAQVCRLAYDVKRLRA